MTKLIIAALLTLMPVSGWGREVYINGIKAEPVYAYKKWAKMTGMSPCPEMMMGCLVNHY